MKKIIFSYFNILYIPLFPFYKILYFLYKSFNDRVELGLLKKFIKPGMIGVDIGANIGFYSIFLANLVQEKGKVYSFEPDKRNFNNLKNDCRDFKNIITENLAVAQFNGKISLYHSKKLNVDHHTYPNHEHQVVTSVKAVTLDKYFPKNQKIDFIKIDIQGYDYFAIYGMQNLIKRSKDLIIIGEFWPYGLRNSGVEPAEYINLLKKLGFKIQNLGRENKNSLNLKSFDQDYYCNFFAIKSP